MIGIISNKCHDLRRPFIITKVVFAALSPLDQIAAKALEKCGKVQIIEEEDQDQPG
jgi:hypothetical protein